MCDVWNVSYFNFGFFFCQEFIVLLLFVYISLNVIGINQEWLFEYNSVENINYLNLDGVVGELECDLVLKNFIIIDGLGVGGRVGKLFVSLFMSSVLDVEFIFLEVLL